MAEGESPPLGDGPELQRRWRASTRGGAGVGGVACRVDGAEQSEAQQGSPRSARLLLGSVLWATLSWVLIASARRARVQAEIIVGRILLKLLRWRDAGTRSEWTPTVSPAPSLAVAHLDRFTEAVN